MGSIVMGTIRSDIRFSAVIKKFGDNGDKTGWIYLIVPAGAAEQIKPGFRKSFRVKGKIDRVVISQTTLLPAGGGDFILPLNAQLRKEIRKPVGATVALALQEDDQEYQIVAELIQCLEDEPEAYARFRSFLPSHQRYFSKWIESAKTQATKDKRIARTVNALLRGLDFGAMMRNE